MSTAKSDTKPGRVFLIGAGPGDPDLLTVKALRMIQGAGLVVYDRLVSQEIMDLIPASAERIYAGKALGNHHLVQDEINDLLLGLALSGRDVVRLKGGDPFVFGRGSEEALFLARHGIGFEVVPGISAAAGCSTYAGIPLTHRGLATGVRFVTGHLREDRSLDLDWPKLADPDITLAVYMGLQALPEISSRLIAAGLPGDTPAAAVERGTTPRQRRVIGTLTTLLDLTRAAGLQAPTLLIIGRVVSLADELDWFSKHA
ncbi:Uroporphyrinogen-III methyltransferase [Paramagnetospirillum magnetotacticum MS-1]|uniref:uroporphyrinogen-III C-methyltransferase n=1 Tax=Paramagnetospirillum magnetotacticum MS-1 TaxID=272627 RepID=A0A0C2UGE9_PARME|nr:uroporphyrinogen-III C-methyltransferase [Paramagnetospirillum magnetotacticum]KIM00593.1 Uroporphyrinogen-III methyltransferase [Paramagnetospirillum magnetotacticum MS-1]